MKRNNRARRREAKRAEDAARLHAARAEVRAEWSRRARESVERRMAELVRQLNAEPLKIEVGSGRFVGDVTGDRIITEAIAAPSFSPGRMDPLSEVVYSTAIREDKMLRLPNGTVIWWVGWRDGSKPSPCRHDSPYNWENGMHGVDWTVTCFSCFAQRRTVLTRSGKIVDGDWIPVPSGDGAMSPVRWGSSGYGILHYPHGRAAMFVAGRCVAEGSPEAVFAARRLLWPGWCGPYKREPGPWTK